MTGQWSATLPGNTEHPGWQGRDDHDQAQGLVQDDGLKGDEPEDADQDGKPKLSAPEPDHAAEDTDPGTARNSERKRPDTSRAPGLGSHAGHRHSVEVSRECIRTQP